MRPFLSRRSFHGSRSLAFEELARTTEPGSAGNSRVPGRLEGLAGPVRAFKFRCYSVPEDSEVALRMDKLEVWIRAAKALEPVFRDS